MVTTWATGPPASKVRGAANESGRGARSAILGGEPFGPAAEAEPRGLRGEAGLLGEPRRELSGRDGARRNDEPEDRLPAPGLVLRPLAPDAGPPVVNRHGETWGGSRAKTGR